VFLAVFLLGFRTNVNSNTLGADVLSKLRLLKSRAILEPLFVQNPGLGLRLLRKGIVNKAVVKRKSFPFLQVIAYGMGEKESALVNWRSSADRAGGSLPLRNPNQKALAHASGHRRKFSVA
jgi:hypothetical protein